MCFSATASFTAAAALVPLAPIALRRCGRKGREDLLPLAVLPLAFSMQQALEGVVWLGLERSPLDAAPRLAALAYLFFAFAFWPVWIPFLASRIDRRSQGIETGPSRAADQPAGRRSSTLLLLQGLGLLLALVLWLPLAVQPQRLEPVLLEGSIDYGTTLLLDGGLLAYGRYLYAAVIGLPLLLLSSARLRGFGIALLASGLGADWFYRQTFASVWCYFSAVLSVLSLWIIWAESAEDQAASESVPAASARPG